MATYMLAQLQLKYGVQNLGIYNATMDMIKQLFERQGVLLRHGSITRVGPLYEAWNLWEIEDQGHMQRAFAGMANEPQGPLIMRNLAEVVIHEQVRFLETLPFHPQST